MMQAATAATSALGHAATTAEESTASKRPTDSAFKQQRLPAWQPILTANSVLPLFFVIGVAFTSIGVGLYYFSNQVKEYSYDYTDCKEGGDNTQGGDMCKKIIEKTPGKTCSCQIKIKGDDLTKGGDSGENAGGDWGDPVFLYYGLDNFYQNHRRYVKSRDDKQLVGKVDGEVNQDCGSFSLGTGEKACQDKEDSDCKQINPCGAIANSLFSDVITMEYSSDHNRRVGDKDGWKDVQLVKKDIAWASDKKYKFKNPGDCETNPEYDTPDKQQKCLCKQFENFAKPTQWKKKLCELDTEDITNNGLQNEDLIIWMRTAALPNFRKLYRKLNLTAIEKEKNGEEDKLSVNKDVEYRFNIVYNFRVDQFQGKKKLILSTTSLLGGKNNFLGIAYIVVGCICVVLGVVFLFIHIKFGKRQSDLLKVNARTNFNN